MTWFGWLIAFALLGAIIQFATTGFCVVVFLRNLLAHNKGSPNIGDQRGSGTPLNSPTSPRSQQTGDSATSSRRDGWRRVKQVLTLQWRSIVLSFVVIIDVVYSGIVYVLMTAAEEKDSNSTHTDDINNWSECLINTSGDKTKCLPLAKPLRLGEGQVVATLFMASVCSSLPCILRLETDNDSSSVSSPSA